MLFVPKPCLYFTYVAVLLRELGSLKNGQSRSSGKELSFISGEYAKSLKMMFALSHYTQFLTLQPVL